MKRSLQILMMFTLAGSPACKPAQESQASSNPAGYRRVVSVSPDATEIIGALGQADKLVAVSTFCLWPPEVKALPRVGGLFDANAEAILNLRPDLIILRGSNNSVERLAQDRHITLFRDQTERFRDIYSTIENLSGLLDCRTRGLEVRQEMEASLRKIRESVGSYPRPKVLMTLARRPDTLGDIMTANRNTFVHEMIVAAGGENAFAGLSMDYPRLSAEAILAARPDVIIEAMPENPQSSETQARALWSKLGPIPAVENQRVHILTDENCLIPSPRIVKVVAKIAHLLHPEARLG
ncbi:MAG TPA: helical backbone metal receptor [Phycisphaerae bacterium]|nr:helical backbone metal receptor [Phycisphaerae bacterium]